MTNNDLSRSYIFKAQKRIKVIELLFKEESYSDVIRESQEIVELAQKAILRKIGVDPPKWHDVSDIISENLELIPEKYHDTLKDLNSIAKWLRGERELSFYGDIDFIPTEEYSKEDAERAIEGARKWVNLASELV